MSKRNWRLLLLYLLLAAAVAGLISVAVTQAREPGGRAVEVVQPVRRTIEDVVYASGQVAPRRQQRVMPEAGLTVETVHVEPGETVKKGDLLVTYDGAELEAQVRQAELEVKRARLEQERAERLWQRARECARRGVGRETGGGGAGRPGDAGSSDAFACAGVPPEEEAALQKEMAELGAEQARLRLDQVKRALARTRVASELDGVVLQVVGPDQAGDPRAVAGGPLVTVGALDDLVVDLILSELDGVRIRPGQPVRIQSDAFPEQAWEGTVDAVGALVITRTGPNGQPETGLPVTVALPPGTPLKPGYTVNLEIVVGEHQALAVPLSALTGDDAAEVWVVQEGRAFRRRLELGLSDVHWVEVRSGLAEGEWVILQPPAGLRPGERVRVQGGGARAPGDGDQQPEAGGGAASGSRPAGT